MTIATDLRADRAKLITDAQSILHGATVSNEQASQADQMLDHAGDIYRRINLIEKADLQAASLHEIVSQTSYRHNISTDQISNDLQNARAYLGASIRNSMGLTLSSKDKRILADVTNLNSQAISPTSSGGYTVATVLQNQLFLAQAQIGSVASVAYTFQTDKGNTLLLPQIDDTGSRGTVTSELGVIGNAANVVVAQTSFGAYTLTTDTFRTSLDLIADSEFDIMGLIENLGNQRLARTANAKYTTGSGSGEPQGLVTAAPTGVTCLSNSTCTYDEILSLTFAIDPVYRPQAAFMFSDSMILTILKLKDSQGHPLWQPSLIAGTPDRLLNYNLYTNVDMAAPAVGATVGLFGVYPNFWIRQVMDYSYQILREVYASTRQIGIIGSMRTDSRAVYPGNWLKAMKMSAT